MLKVFSYYFFPVLLLASCTQPEPPAHPARALAEAEILPRLADSASYSFTNLIVDTVTAAEAIDDEIATEQSRQRQYRQRILLKAQSYLAAAGTDVSDDELDRMAASMGLPGLVDSVAQKRIDSLMALNPSPTEVVRYEVLLTHKAKNEDGAWTDMYWDLTFDPNWQVMEVRKDEYTE